MIFVPLHTCTPLCIGLSREIPIKLIHICGCNVTKCGKAQRGRILLQATLYVNQLHKVLNSMIERCLRNMEVKMPAVHAPDNI